MYSTILDEETTPLTHTHIYLPYSDRMSPKNERGIDLGTFFNRSRDQALSVKLIVPIRIRCFDLVNIHSFQVGDIR